MHAILIPPEGEGGWLARGSLLLRVGHAVNAACSLQVKCIPRLRLGQIYKSTSSIAGDTRSEQQLQCNVNAWTYQVISQIWDQLLSACTPPWRHRGAPGKCHQGKCPFPLTKVPSSVFVGV